jgi:hypothetical protein
MPPDEITEHVVRLREDAAGWRRVNGPEVDEDDPFLVGLSENEAATLAGSQWALRESSVDEAEAFYYGTSTVPFDPDGYSVDELETKLSEGDYSADELDALSDAESEGANRTTALDAIDAARED